jgi:hypothetical protein
MASIRKQVSIHAPLPHVWDALRDVGALHVRLCPGFVTNVEMDGSVRVVTFGNGMVAREPIIDVDDVEHRVAWTTEGGLAKHYNASAQVFAEGDDCRFVWIADLLPHELAPTVAGMMDQGLRVIKQTLEKRE